MQVKHRKGRLLHRLLWNVREIPVAWELDADVVCSFWTRLFPLSPGCAGSRRSWRSTSSFARPTCGHRGRGGG